MLCYVAVAVIVALFAYGVYRLYTKRKQDFHLMGEQRVERPNQPNQPNQTNQQERIRSVSQNDDSSEDEHEKEMQMQHRPKRPPHFQLLQQLQTQNTLLSQQTRKIRDLETTAKGLTEDVEGFKSLLQTYQNSLKKVVGAVKDLRRPPVVAPIQPPPVEARVGPDVLEKVETPPKQETVVVMADGGGQANIVTSATSHAFF
jgi:hypothetical protein